MKARHYASVSMKRQIVEEPVDLPLLVNIGEDIILNGVHLPTR